MDIHPPEGDMDKRKVIAAYRSGLINVQECAQILGVDHVHVIGLIRDSGMAIRIVKPKQSVRS
jgi:transposase-like protein